jgi:hypothetical protein
MSSWIEQEFARIDLGDKRLSKRLLRVAERMWESPRASIASASGTWKETVAAYRFFDNESVMLDPILKGHRDQVAARAGWSREVLHIQDTTELDYSGQKSFQGAGPLSEKSRQGFFAHNEYVVQGDGLPLGVWHTHVYARDPEEHGRKSEQRKQLPIEEKESFRWVEGYQRACEIKALHPRLAVVSLSDRESDVYETFEEHERRKSLGLPTADWIIRSRHDRLLLPPEEDEDREMLKLHSHVSQAPVLGTTTIRISAKTQLKKVKGNRQKSLRTARLAVLEIRACQVQLRPPPRPGRKLNPITVWVLQAKEMNPPANEEPVEWILLTNLAVRTLKKARQILQRYSMRWQIEVFHKILKSGCAVEKSQLKTAERLLPRIALQMVMAWRIHYLTMLGRACPDLPCGAVFDPGEWKPVVVVLRGKGAEKNEPSLGEMIKLIGQLGGHLNRKSDGDPGPQSLWRGLQRLHDLSLLWRALQ